MQYAAARSSSGIGRGGQLDYILRMTPRLTALIELDSLAGTHRLR